MNTRFNIFNNIHKGLRAMSYDSAMALQLNDFTSTEKTQKVFDDLNQVLRAFRGHAGHEDNYILPVIHKYNVELVNKFEKEHLTDMSFSGRLYNLMTIYNRAVSYEAKHKTGKAICKTFDEFIAFNLHHMNGEEEQINRELWAHFSDNEIIGLQNVIWSTISPELMIIEGTWIMRAINNQEIIDWMMCMKNGPCSIFDSLLKIAENVLPPDRWSGILEAMCEGSMVA